MNRKKVTETDSFKYRVNLGHEGLTLLKKEYQLLDWFNTLNHVERGCWWDRDYDALESLLNFLREEYNMVPSTCPDGSINRYTLTYAGDPDEYCPTDNDE
tara:strand:+ start:93 stop:392 length:300 start_codon:yes stop_codon:yes gene_type:complete